MACLAERLVLDMQERLITKTQAAAELECASKTIDRMIERGDLAIKRMEGKKTPYVVVYSPLTPTLVESLWEQLDDTVDQLRDAWVEIECLEQRRQEVSNELKIASKRNRELESQSAEANSSLTEANTRIRELTETVSDLMMQIESQAEEFAGKLKEESKERIPYSTKAAEAEVNETNLRYRTTAIRLQGAAIGVVVCAICMIGSVLVI